MTIDMSLSPLNVTNDVLVPDEKDKERDIYQTRDLPSKPVGH